MRIVVVGAGGVGGYFGGRLAAAGHQVTFLARGQNLQTLQCRGTIRLQSPESDEVIGPIHATHRTESVGAVDAVIVAVKAWQVSEIAESLEPLIGSKTVVLSLQNGVEAPRQLAKVVGDKHVLGGVCVVIAYLDGPGHVCFVGRNSAIEMGSLTGNIGATAHRLRDAFTQAGVRCEISDEINVALWRKLLLISSYGGVGAVARAPVGVTRLVPETRQMIETAMAEVVDVARAHDVPLGPDDIGHMMAQVDAFHSESTASMQRDIAAGRPSELDYQSGAVVRLAEQVGVQAPIHQFIYASLLPAERRARGDLDY
ncbi:MAG: 2-dehydropantoate 2-reductase [Streptosporangiales bacterium]|nr:2-dehydropantoate 2-reductase [Streptosporangiales bacterium]